MKTKWILGILAVSFVWLISSDSQGSDKFYYGTYGGRYEQDFPSIGDSLKFNIVYSVISEGSVQHFVQNGLRALAWSSDTTISPGYWASQSHYTMWEAEGYPGSNFGLHFSGGSLVDDTSASGGKAMKWRVPETTQKIQWGPTYYQEPKLGQTPIDYTAEFRLKFVSALHDPPNRGGSAPAPVCSIMVVDVARDTILKAKTLNKNHFLGGTYRTFTLEDYNVLDTNKIEFQIYVFGTTEAVYFYVDYVKVYDENGYRLVYLGLRDEAIMAYVDSPWVQTTLSTGETVVYRWYLRDEPSSIDLFEPNRHVDSLLREVSAERVGFQAFNKWWRNDLEDDYFLRVNPEEYNVDLYFTSYWGPGYSGPDFQSGLNTLTYNLNQAKLEAEEREKEFWMTIQAHYYGIELLPGDTTCCTSCSLQVDRIPHPGWYCSNLKRPPTANELRVQTFLSLCYGADAILNSCYYSRNEYDATTGRWVLMLGLYETMGDTTTVRWREIRDFTGPRMEVLGPVFHELTWQGACFHDTVGSFVLRNQQASYIDSIVGVEPESSYIEVGFFEDAAANRYFMLVNRRTLESQQDTAKVYLNFPDGPYIATDMYTGSPVDKLCGFNPLEVGLEPGEGRLFKLEKLIAAPGYLLFVPQDYDHIQDAIDVSSWYTTILVEPGTYYENLDFRGHNPTVTSYLHLYPDSTSLIENTIIDGSAPSDSDTASVVRFVNSETAQAVLKGFTIRNGKGTEYIDKGEPNPYGGGIYCYYSSPTIINNIIAADTAMYGGGIYCCNSFPQILNNMIVENAADSGYGGGIAIENFQQPYSGPIVVNNVIASNSAGIRGGGIYYAGQPIVTNNTVDLNSAEGDGGGIFVNMAYGGRIENNIVTNSQDGGGLRGYSEADLIAYNDVWNNTEGNFSAGYLGGVGDTTCDSTNRNGTPCDAFHNIVRNPLFYDGYHLDDESECVNAGDNEAMYVPPADFEGNQRVKDEWVDMGAYENQGGGRAGGGAKYAAGNQSGNGEASTSTPYSFALPQNYPNPFNPVTNISFSVGGDKSASQVTLKIYNIVGQLVRTMVDDVRMPGSYVVAWDGRDSKGKEVASGIYFYRLKAAEFTECRKMVLLK
jgi:hypothetical protein